MLLRVTTGCATLAALMLGSACAGPGGRTDAAAVWTLSTEPDLVIGSDSIPEQTFGAIAGVAALASGAIATADARTAEIRLFSAEGAFLRTLARRGQGPGEFMAIEWIQASAGSLLVNDILQNRVTVLSLDGSPPRVTRPEPDPAYQRPAVQARLASGHWLATAHVPRSGPRVPGLNQDSTIFGILPPDAAGPLQPIARMAGMAMVVVEGAGSAPARFRRGGFAVVVGARAAVIDPDSGVVRWFNAGGDMVGEASIPLEAIALTPALADAALAAEKAAMPNEQAHRMWDALFAIEPRPTHLPLVRLAVADGDAAIWLEAFSLDQNAAARYVVIRDDGARVAELTAPAGFTVHQVGPGWVLGVHRDADGVQRVMRYGLTRR